MCTYISSGHGGSRLRGSSVPGGLQQCHHPAGAEVHLPIYTFDVVFLFGPLLLLLINCESEIYNDESEIYVTASPCYDCFKLIANAGIKKVFFGEFYRDERINKFAKSAKIELIDLSK